MGNGLRPNAWRRTLDDQGQPLTRPGARTSTLMFLLAHGHAPAVDLALQHGLRTLSAEDCRFPSLALAVVWLSRTRRTTPDDGLAPVARLEREAALLGVLRHHEVQGLPHAQTGTTLTHAARQDAPRAVLDGLQEHGIDPKALQAHHRVVQVTLTALLTAPLLEGGSVATLDRFLSWGLPFSQGPGDDRTALQIVGSYGIARSHPVDFPAAVARRQQILLCTLERHGWVPGPRFRREAFCVAAASAADPSLWPHLSARGADPHGRDPAGNTALHLLGHANTRPEHVQGLLDLCLSPLALNDAAGADSGMSRASASRIDGYGGVWNAPISSSPALGLLGFQVGTGTTLYSVYLRRDGTLPMTGDLNLSDGINHNIYNASNVTGTGRFTSTQAYTNYVNLAGNLDMSGTATIQGNADVKGQVLAQGTVWSATGLQTSGAVSAGSTITANGDITGNYLVPTGTSILGGPCSKNGEIGTDGNKTMFCQLGIWLPSSYAYPNALDTNSFHGSGLGPTTLPMAIPSGATYAMMTSSGHCYSAPGDSCEIFINGVLAQISQAPTGGGSIWQSVSTGWTPDASLILAGGTMTVIVENVNSGGSVTAAPTYGRMDVTWFFE